MCYYGFRLVHGYCLSCALTEYRGRGGVSSDVGIGYINCNEGCADTKWYARDGDILTDDYSH